MEIQYQQYSRHPHHSSRDNIKCAKDIYKTVERREGQPAASQPACPSASPGVQARINTSQPASQSEEQNEDITVNSSSLSSPFVLHSKLMAIKQINLYSTNNQIIRPHRGIFYYFDTQKEDRTRNVMRSQRKPPSH